jgi:hypothetical protein
MKTISFVKDKDRNGNVYISHFRLFNYILYANTNKEPEYGPCPYPGSMKHYNLQSPNVLLPYLCNNPHPDYKWSLRHPDLSGL